jgi:hypothetical protein
LAQPPSSSDTDRRGERDGGGHSTGDLTGGFLLPLLGMTCGVGGPTINPWGARLGEDPDGSSIFGQLVFQKMKKKFQKNLIKALEIHNSKNIAPKLMRKDISCHFCDTFLYSFI